MQLIFAPPPNKRLKLTPHVGVFDLSPVRCSFERDSLGCPISYGM